MDPSVARSHFGAWEHADRLLSCHRQFLDWCQRAGFRSLEDIEPITVAAYIEQHPSSPATIKQHMSAIRMLFSWLTEKGILAMNPAREVKTEKFSRREGKTPAFDTEQVKNRRPDHFRPRFLQLNRRLNLLFAAKSWTICKDQAAAEALFPVANLSVSVVNAQPSINQ